MVAAIIVGVSTVTIDRTAKSGISANGISNATTTAGTRWFWYRGGSICLVATIRVGAATPTIDGATKRIVGTNPISNAASAACA